MKTQPSSRKEARVLLARARRAHAAGDPQARFAIPWMEYVLDDSEKEPSGEPDLLRQAQTSTNQPLNRIPRSDGEMTGFHTDRDRAAI